MISETIGPIERKLGQAIENEGCVHLALLDPERPLDRLTNVVRELESLGTFAVMVGGSTVASTVQLDRTVETIKSACGLPTILFPNGEEGISRRADAIFFMSLLNSSNPRFLIGAQAKGAPLVKAYGIEPIPLGYIVVGDAKTAVSRVGEIDRVPYSRPELAAGYALASQYLGMRFIYLEAGSGASEPVDLRMVEKVTSSVEVPVIVGGGIRTGEQARRLAEAGTSAIVTGTLLEQEGVDRVRDIVGSIRRVQTNVG